MSGINNYYINIKIYIYLNSKLSVMVPRKWKVSLQWKGICGNIQKNWTYFDFSSSHPHGLQFLKIFQAFYSTTAEWTFFSKSVLVGFHLWRLGALKSVYFSLKDAPIKKRYFYNIFLITNYQMWKTTDHNVKPS